MHSADTLSTPPALAGRREWIGLAVIALPCLVYAMDMTVLNLALPAISTQLQPSASQLLWIVDIYGFFVAGFLITMGTLGDRIGRRRLLMVGAAAFAGASLLAAFANSAAMLVAMRALLGVAGATLAPSTLSLIRNMFHDERQRQFAIGIWIASFSAGGAIGPLVGGLLLQFFWWGSVFLVAVPVMVLLLVLGPRLLPEYRDPDAGRLDLPSVALSLGAVLPTIYGLKQLAEHGLALLPGGMVLAGLVIGTLFVRRQGRLAYPLLDLKLFRLPVFRGAIAAYGLSCLAMLGLYIFITQYLQLVRGLSPLDAGLVTVPWALGFVVGSMTAPLLARHWAPSRVLVSGLAAAAVGTGLVAGVGVDSGLPLLMLAMVVMSLGMAQVFTLGTEMIVSSAPPERTGAASAIAETSAEFFGALGIAVFGSLGTVLYRSGLEAAALGPLTGAALAQASTTLGGAIAVADGLPATAAELLRAGARAAFTHAMQQVAGITALIMALAALVSARILRPPARPPATPAG